jgi:hypothetical protein
MNSTKTITAGGSSTNYEYWPSANAKSSKETQTMALLRGSLFLDLNFAVPTWEVLVAQYTSKSMIVETDVLLALGGLAAEVSHRYPGKYLAGIWECDLLRQLLWRRHHDNRTDISSSVLETKLESYIAPSWSWASIHGDLVKFLPTVLFPDGLPLIRKNSLRKRSRQAVDPLPQSNPSEMDVRQRLIRQHRNNSLGPVWPCGGRQNHVGRTNDAYSTSCKHVLLLSFQLSVCVSGSRALLQSRTTSRGVGVSIHHALGKGVLPATSASRRDSDFRAP